MERRDLEIDRRMYAIDVHRRTHAPVGAPRLVVVGYQPNPVAREILRLCLDSIRAFTATPHELWVVDNASPAELSAWLADEDGVNVVFNRTRPREPAPLLGRYVAKPVSNGLPSYANGTALEIAARVIDPQSRFMMTLHMDTMACHPEWLDYLLAQFSARRRGVGVRLDTMRVRTLHVLGMMFDFQQFAPLRMSFLPDLPAYDVGDGISIALERAGYELWACRNTHTDPRLADALPANSPFRRLHVDRALNDRNEVIFTHLGRGILKTEEGAIDGKTTPEDWLAQGRDLLATRTSAGAG
jgi:hypothetical protein